MSKMLRMMLTAASFATVLAPTVVFAQACAPKLVPPHVVEAGKLSMMINPTQPPMQFVDEKGQVQGLNVEIGREIAKRLCLEPVFISMDFPAMFPALKARRFDVMNPGVFWTEERSKIAYLVPYAQQAFSVLVLKDSKLQLKTFDDLSGLVVGVAANTYQEKLTREMNAAMVAKGLKPIDLHVFNNASDTVSALRAGQTQADIEISDLARDLEKRGWAQVPLTGLGAADITIAFQDKDVAQASAEVLTAIRADGVYDKVFDKFGLTRLPATTFAIRGPGPS
jgi:polar amino acid transport system substrate-binding protein